ncbi:MAG: 2-succinyl-5-enolpyruvyl-6-hydroxy-3-cyclohexene-1-carboxylic-acid synthase [Bacteroidetes bacterium]|nr:2-succinyl-5-enolpyruvyl-6-hydroxy-3-cyclohexene-1-carboxylic-acid synthase [Bacteroidota bacterium]
MLFRQLSRLGVNNVVVCPGSRSTPLIFGIESQKKIKTYNLVDERSAGFFALGLSKASNEPVAVITTSGTAVAELYPAIVEAYQQRIPLIICTADRPPELQDCGANQTINQKNIFANHIRYYFESDLPSVRYEKVKKLLTLIKKALKIAVTKDRGPVHINLPFRKPFESDSFTDTISKEDFEKIVSLNVISIQATASGSLSRKLFSEIEKSKKGLIIFNEKNADKKTIASVLKLSTRLNFPIIDDATSGLRFSSQTNSLLCKNATTILRSDNFADMVNPDLIIQFGDAPVSNSLLKFYQRINCNKILVNEFGDIKDPSKSYRKIVSMKTVDFCEAVISKVALKKEIVNSTRKLLRAEILLNEVKSDFLRSCDFSFEGKIINKALSQLPSKTNVFFSNSMPVRDLDTFSPDINNNLNIYTNRGASGIDGITSTALGIAARSKFPTVLIIGDLAFYHDLNGLLASYKYSIPLTILLINNNGGGIFENLPISNYGKLFKKNFITPTNLDFEPFVKGFGGEHTHVKSSDQLIKHLLKSISSRGLNVLEIETDSLQSAKLRKQYASITLKEIEKTINVD